MPEEELLGLADRVVGWAGPGEQVEAYVSRARYTEVKVFGREVESLSVADTAGVGVRVIVGGRQGFAYSGSLDPATLPEVLAEARDNASFATPDDHAGLPAPDGVEPAALDLYRAELADVASADKVDMALAVEAATLAADGRVRGVESAGYDDTIAASAVASTSGVRASSRRTVCSVHSVALAGDGDSTQTGYGWSIGRHAADLDLEQAALDAAQRATRLLGATKPASRRCTVVLEPRITARLLGTVASALSAEPVLKGRSLFAGLMGQPVAAASLSLVDDPTDPRSFGAAVFDAEGLATRRNPLLDRGVLRGYLHNAYTARRAGVSSNACAVRGGFKSTPGAGSRAPAIAAGPLGRDQLLAEVGDGLLVQSVSGMHSGVSTVSGDFSVGVEGLLLRHGEPAEPVREATIASTLQEMLRGVVAVGADLQWLPGGAAGVTLAIEGVALSGS